MPEVIVTTHFFERFNERVGPLDKNNLATIIKETPVEDILKFFGENGTSYAKVTLKGLKYFVAYKYDNNDGNLILLSMLDEEIFLDKQRREFIKFIYNLIPQTRFKRKVQTYGTYRRDIFAKTKDGRFSENYQ